MQKRREELRAREWEECCDTLSSEHGMSVYIHEVTEAAMCTRLGPQHSVVDERRVHKGPALLEEVKAE